MSPSSRNPSRPWVYVAGPYSKPDPVVNVRRACEVAEDLDRLGFHPIVPHLCHIWHLVSPHEYRFWIDYDLELLSRCDALLRFPGDSLGADDEIRNASRIGIPVFFDRSTLLRAHEVGKLRGPAS